MKLKLNHVSKKSPRSVTYNNTQRLQMQKMLLTTPDSKVQGANMGPTWVLSAPDGPHVGPMNLAIRDGNYQLSSAQKERPKGTL